MPNKHEVKSEVDRNTSADHPPDIDGDDDDSEFVEVDPTGRYGRYDDVLGKGAFKTVYRAFDEVDGIEVAWNQVKVQDVLKSPDDLERLYSEVHLLKTLKHKNIIKFYNSWVDTKTKNVNFITEIFTSGTLRQYRKKHKHVDIKAVKNWSRQILRGLLYLHSHDPPIIHRDLKCDNIFVNGNQGEVKIGDLGLAAILRQAHAAHSVIGTPEFMAPELYEEEYNELVDIYSFGMCLLEMVTFEYPYSECTNAAQIYKKVTSGKKPAALEKVKDPEVRAFVEKCLAAASIRLPARELLMDSFLQCEGDREALECGSSLLIAKCRIDDMEELGVVFENPVPSMPQLADFHTKQKGLGDHSDSQADVVITSEKPPPSSVAWEPEAEDHPQPRNSHFESDKYSGEKERARRSSRDFRVKGKRGDDDTIYLRLRIADHDGHSRNIHFPFDIEMDTAMSVASEMVAELDLSDQDVTTIAEMIDVEILALVPEWTPGVAVDDTGATDGETGGPNEDSYPQEPDESEPIATISSEDSMTEQLASSWKPRSFSPKISSIAGTSPPRVVEGTMHGRFEEVTYRTRSDLQQRGPEDPVVFSSDSSEGHIRGEEDWEHDRSKSEASVADSASPTRGSFSSGLKHTDLAEEDCHSEAGSFDELGEARSTSSAQYTGRLQEEGGVEDNQGFYRSNDHIENGGLLSDWSNHSEDEEATTNRELERLTLQQKEELRDLQHRHEQALLAIKNRMWQKPSKSISSHSQHTHSSNEDFRRSNIRNQTFRSTQPRSASCVDLRSKQFLETRNGKLPSEESEVLSRLASRKGAGMSSGYVNFMDEPRGFGLDHNLQGHFSQESSSDSRYNRRHSWKPDTATREHGKFKEHYFY